MRRLIITGANGAGKSHLARRCHMLRPDIPLVSFDAMKLTTGWVQRPRSDINATLSNLVAQDCWILEGGPTLLPLAMPRADAVVWLDPSARVRAWRLLIRPLKRIGRTRPELPAGNIDWPWQQYRFAWRSLRKSGAIRAFIAQNLRENPDLTLWQCRRQADIDAAVTRWQTAANPTSGPMS